LRRNGLDSGYHRRCGELLLSLKERVSILIKVFKVIKTFDDSLALDRLYEYT
jgi:hypothetical protein